MTFLTGNCRCTTSQPNRTWSGLSNSQCASDRARHRRLSRGLLQAQRAFQPPTSGELKVLGRGTTSAELAESAGPKPSRNANFSVAPGRGSPPTRGCRDSSPPQGLWSLARRMGGVLGAARGVHLPASETRHMCRVQVPSFRAGTDEAHWEKPTDQAGVTCVSIRLRVSPGGKGRPAAAVGAAGSLPAASLSSSVSMADVALGPTAGLSSSPPRGRVQLGGVFRPGALVF